MHWTLLTSKTPFPDSYFYKTELTMFKNKTIVFPPHLSSLPWLGRPQTSRPFMTPPVFFTLKPRLKSPLTFLSKHPFSQPSHVPQIPVSLSACSTHTRIVFLSTNVTSLLKKFFHGFSLPTELPQYNMRLQTGPDCILSAVLFYSMQRSCHGRTPALSETYEILLICPMFLQPQISFFH